VVVVLVVLLVALSFIVRIAVATHGALIFGFPAEVKPIPGSFATFARIAEDPPA
jgi:hypothetical protein